MNNPFSIFSQFSEIFSVFEKVTDTAYNQRKYSYENAINLEYKKYKGKTVYKLFKMQSGNFKIINTVTGKTLSEDSDELSIKQEFIKVCKISLGEL